MNGVDNALTAVGDEAGVNQQRQAAAAGVEGKKEGTAATPVLCNGRTAVRRSSFHCCVGGVAVYRRMCHTGSPATSSPCDGNYALAAFTASDEGDARCAVGSDFVQLLLCCAVVVYTTPQQYTWTHTGS